jgi:hypothetical protein
LRSKLKKHVVTNNEIIPPINKIPKDESQLKLVDNNHVKGNEHLSKDNNVNKRRRNKAKEKKSNDNNVDKVIVDNLNSNNVVTDKTKDRKVVAIIGDSMIKRY